LSVRKIVEGVYNVGAIDWDRPLFDELIPLPDGTSYNSFIVEGSEKTAMIDAVEPDKEDEFRRNLEEYGLKKLDYIISNHAEQDHSGLIPYVLEMFPAAKVVTNKKCKGFLMDLLPLKSEQILEVKDGETLSLGDRTLEFISAPLVHWPETMFTYLQEDRILFSGDFLGSHLAVSHTFSKDDARTYQAAKRYYAEIMMPFRAMIKKHLKKLDEYEIDIVCSVHGPVYRNPEFITSAYKEWVSDDVENKVIIPFVSMHGSTRKMVEYLTDEIYKRGIEVEPINMVEAELGRLTVAMVDAATIVLASPTVLVGPHPTMLYTASLINALRPKTRYMAIMNSYGWASKCVATLKNSVGNVQSELIKTIEVKGHPEDQDYNQVKDLADLIEEKHRELKLI